MGRAVLFGERKFQNVHALTPISAPPGTEVTDTTEVIQGSDWLTVDLGVAA